MVKYRMSLLKGVELGNVANSRGSASLKSDFQQTKIILESSRAVFAKDEIPDFVGATRAGG